MNDLAGRRVLVTGASSGIGAETARVLAERGAQVVAVARRPDALNAAVAGLPGDGHRALPLDVADPAAWDALDGSTVTDVVCAAGVLGPVGPIGTYAPADLADVYAVNVIGALSAIDRCLPGLVAAGGAVVTFSGGGGTAPFPRYDAYAASKAAVVRLSENLAVELRDRGVRVNSVAPGFVATPMHQGTLRAGPELAGAAYHARTARELDEGGVPPTEAAELVALLLSADGAAITGKLVSAQWDPWREVAFRTRLAAEPELATLRRVDDVFVRAVPEDER